MERQLLSRQEISTVKLLVFSSKEVSGFSRKHSSVGKMTQNKKLLATRKSTSALSSPSPIQFSNFRPLKIMMTMVIKIIIASRLSII